MLITLVGMPASGKSTTGKRLAKELQYQFIDLDREIEKQTGLSITQLFQQAGETAFREIERRVLLQNLHHQDTILAMGGGTPCFADNMQHILDNSLCLYVLSDLREASNRICYAETGLRPMFAHLSQPEIYQRLEELYEERHPYYAQAHVFLVCEEL